LEDQQLRDFGFVIFSRERGKEAVWILSDMPGRYEHDAPPSIQFTQSEAIEMMYECRLAEQRHG
jgi:hypothetical protein